jgi:ribosomal protein S18 acetylase RimI-like enzyme
MFRHAADDGKTGTNGNIMMTDLRVGDVGDGVNGKASKNHINSNGHVNGHLNGHANGHNGHSNGVHSQLAEKIIIRPYAPTDRTTIRQICCDTGFLGDPIETIFTDREVFADLFTSPYLNYEPNCAWVAETDGRVVGYLLGSVSPSFDYTLLYSGFQTTMKMIARAATGQYARHPRNKHFIRWLLTSGYREQPRHPDRAAHLHLDIEKDYRGHGLACRLWRAFEKQLEHSNVEHCYGAFFSWGKRRPENGYSRFGFSVFDRRLTTIFHPEISDPVEVVCVQKKLRE